MSLESTIADLVIVNQGLTAAAVAATNAANDVSKKVQSGALAYGLDSGISNAYRVAYAPEVTSLIDGMELKFRPSNTNTGVATFAPNGVASASILSQSFQPLYGGEIVAAGYIGLTWNSSKSAWILTDNFGGMTRIGNGVVENGLAFYGGVPLPNSVATGLQIGQTNNNARAISTPSASGSLSYVTCGADANVLELSCGSTLGSKSGFAISPAYADGKSDPGTIKIYIGGTTKATFDNSGNFLLGVPTGSAHVIQKNTLEGSSILAINSQASCSAEFYSVGTGGHLTGANMLATGFRIGKNLTTGRSIAATGTVNAAGADYAEYEYKKASCSSILAGQIIGFDIDGLITDRFESAVSFAIKSTNPSIVGGDSWGDETAIGAKPVEPKPVDLPGLRAQPQLPEQSQFIEVAEYALAVAAHQADHAKWREEQFAHVQLTLAAELKHTTAMQEYQSALDVWTNKLEAVRATVDRIAYCGKVPVNLTGAKIGDYLLPIMAKDGGISGKWVTSAEIDKVPGDYRRAIGQVRKLLPDGRALVVVKPI
ncbi:hypothetical protein [Iodobacter sp.]|uniref:hypothetical protein n=1 Tax=Iodobacter sp. TaxID=1915058 RepID=UPI0025E246A7|nr:hypothetical protein [Iodobacter sp.]